jgi:anti-sigma regulatory factor (Ser/Thr protein kinase)
VDGDFYDFFEYNPDCLDVVVGDIMGKGTTAALLGAATKNHFLRARNRLAPGLNGRLPDPADIVNQVHSVVTPEFARPDIGVFVTLFYARFDLNGRVCTFVDCGHTKTLQLHLNEDRCGTLEGDNVPIGVLIQENYEQHSTTFAPGDIFVLYSDGITEAHNPEGLYFGVGGIERVVLECRHRDSGEIVSAIVQRTSEFTRGVGLSDDATCLVVKVAPLEKAACRLPAALGQIEKARNFVQAFCASLTHAKVPEDAVIKAELGLVEALTNIIKHAFSAGAGHDVDLRMEAYSDRVCIRLDYEGPFFEPGAVSVPNAEDMAESGYGLFIVQQCFDQVEYFVAEDRRSAVLMVKDFRDDMEGNPIHAGNK